MLETTFHPDFGKYDFRTPPSTISSSTLISRGGQPGRLFCTAETMSLSILSNA
jgi:hypothetical protein